VQRTAQIVEAGEDSAGSRSGERGGGA